MSRRVLLLVLCVAASTLAAIGVAAPPASADSPTSGAVNVVDFGADGTDASDDTAAFSAAIDAATAPGATTYAPGPTGDPQGVVYVPAGTYRLLNLRFASNVRMEVDAGAVLAQAGGRNASAPPEYTSPAPTLILWDGPQESPLRNVSIVGVGSTTGGRKAAADPVAPGWSVAESFTFDLDPATTDANNLVSAILAINVDGFLIARVLSIQNDSQPATTPSNNASWWPGSRKAALILRARRDTPLGGPYYDPHNGTVADWYNVASPRGFGPNQITSGHNLSFARLYSQGGTTLRLETDNSDQTLFGSEVRNVVATDVVGVRCNRAVAFSPHVQHNFDVDVANVHATACYQGVVEAIDEGASSDRRGSFSDSTLTNVTVVGGDGAQVPVANSNGKWTVGRAYQAFGRERLDTWAVTYTANSFSCSESFTRASDRLRTTTGEVRPACAVAPPDPGGPIGAPTGVTATALSPSKIRVNWKAVAGATGYRLARATVAGGPYTTVGETTERKLVDTRRVRNTTYFYVVYALSGAEASPPSSEVPATTFP